MKMNLFRSVLIQHGRISWRGMNSFRMVVSPELLKIVFIHYNQWGYVNNIYPVMNQIQM